MVSIEKILLALTYLFLNMGLYSLFISPLRNRVNKLTKGAFSIVFLLVCALLGIYRGTSNEEFNMSLSLMGFYIIGNVLYRVASLSYKSQGKQLNKRLIVILSGVFALLVSIVQILILFD